MIFPGQDINPIYALFQKQVKYHIYSQNKLKKNPQICHEMHEEKQRLPMVKASFLEGTLTVFFRFPKILVHYVGCI